MTPIRTDPSQIQCPDCEVFLAKGCLRRHRGKARCRAQQEVNELRAQGWEPSGFSYWVTDLLSKSKAIREAPLPFFQFWHDGGFFEIRRTPRLGCWSPGWLPTLVYSFASRFDEPLRSEEFFDYIKRAFDDEEFRTIELTLAAIAEMD